MIDPNAPLIDDSAFSADELGQQVLDSARRQLGLQIEDPASRLGDLLIHRAMDQINAREEAN